MDNLVKRAKELLENKSVQVIIGYEAGPTGVIRPAFITDPARADRLIFNEKCVLNLAVYLTKKEVNTLG